MHDNVPSHAGKRTSNYLQKIDFKNRRVVVWPPFSPDLNSIENLGSIINRKVYASLRQFPTKTESWDAISTTVSNNNTSKIMYQNIVYLDEKLLYIHAITMHNYYFPNLQFYITYIFICFNSFAYNSVRR